MTASCPLTILTGAYSTPESMATALGVSTYALRGDVSAATAAVARLLVRLHSERDMTPSEAARCVEVAEQYVAATSFAAQVKRWRTRHGYTQAQAGAAAGVSAAAVCVWERDDRDTHARALRAIVYHALCEGTYDALWGPTPSHQGRTKVEPPPSKPEPIADVPPSFWAAIVFAQMGGTVTITTSKDGDQVVTLQGAPTAG